MLSTKPFLSFRDFIISKKSIFLYIFPTLATFILFLDISYFIKREGDRNLNKSLLAGRKLSEIFKQNENFLKYLGKIVLEYGGQEKTNLEYIIKSTSYLSPSSFTTSYVSWSDKDGDVIVSGKSGLIKKGERSISTRSYFKAARQEPWVIKTSNPIKSIFSSKYILPTAFGVSDKKGEFRGYFLLGLKLDELYELLGLRFNKGVYGNFYLYDVRNKVYIPKFNTDDETYFMRPDESLHKKIKLKDSDYEIHIYQSIDQFLWSYLSKRGEVFILILVSLLIIFCTVQKRLSFIKVIGSIFNLNPSVSESVLIKNIKSYIGAAEREKRSIDQELDKIKFTKQILEKNFFDRESYNQEIMQRVYDNCEDLETLLEMLLLLGKHTDQAQDLLHRCQDIVKTFMNMSSFKGDLYPFSFNSIVKRSIEFYTYLFQKEKIQVRTRYFRLMPVCMGDSIPIQQAIIIILGKIIENGFGLESIHIFTKYSQTPKNRFSVCIKEKIKQNDGIYKYSTYDLEQRVKSIGASLSVDVSSNARTWDFSYVEKESESKRDPCKNGGSVLALFPS